MLGETHKVCVMQRFLAFFFFSGLALCAAVGTVAGVAVKTRQASNAGVIHRHEADSHAGGHASGTSLKGHKHKSKTKAKVDQVC